MYIMYIRAIDPYYMYSKGHTYIVHVQQNMLQ